MDPATRRQPPLNPDERNLLRALIDQAVRARTTTPTGRLCPECGADTRDLPEPVTGCETCHDRFATRRRRAKH